jgi:pyruvate/2-oxoglutarate dehydrogenase complex dihydrolipoamide acyltransferase (E2) component
MAERVFNLPDLGEGLEEAEIVEWKVAEGDTVELNQPLVEVNTAKAVVEIPSPFAGKVLTLHGAGGDVVKVGRPLVTIEVEAGAQAAEAGATPEEAASEGVQAAAERTEARAEQTAERPKREAVLVGYGVDAEEGRTSRRPRLRPPGTGRDGPSEIGPISASPVVRRLARELGVDLADVKGSGPAGRVTREDIERTAQEGVGTAAGAEETPSSRPAGAEERIPVRGIRRLVAQKMTRAWAEVPMVTTFRNVDATHVDALRTELSQDAGRKISPLAIVVGALVQVCGEHPKLNSWYDAEAHEIVLVGPCHVGIATDTERGLMVPVVRDADRKGVLTLADEIAELVSAAREGRATPDQLTGSTITVTNVGSFGSEFGTPIVNFPEAAILALGVVESRPLVVDGEIEARPAVTLSLTFDHRVLDGADAGRAMTALQQLMESPFRLGALPRR